MPTSENGLLLYRNWFDDATLSASSAATPVARLQDPRPSRRWAATGDTAEYVLGTLDADRSMTHLLILGHNMTTAGTIRARIADNSGMTSPAYDSGVVNAWDPVAGFGYDGFGISLGGFPILSDFADYRPYKLFDLGTTYTEGFVRFDFADPANPDGQIRVGWAFAGLGLQSAINFDKDWSKEWADPSEQIETEESIFVRRRRPYRILRMRFANLSQSEAINGMDDLQRIVGRARPMVAVPFPNGDAVTRYKTTVYGVRQETAPIVGNPALDDVYSTEIVIREIPA